MSLKRPVPGAGVRATCALLSLLVLLLVPQAARAQSSTTPSPPAAAQACPGTFQVLNDTRIGQLRLAKGPYRITPQGGLSCASAARQFTTFLGASYDGVLASPWRLVLAERRFVRGTADGGAGFTVSPLDATETSASARDGCPVPYTQPRQVTVGSLKVPRGRFQLTLVRGSASCQRLTELIAGFLGSNRRTLPSGWSYASPTFTNARQGLAFRFRLVGTAGEDTEGGGSFPAKGTICPGSVSIERDDRLGALRVRAGRYVIAAFGSRFSCADAERQLRAFQRKTNGRLHRPWVVDADTSVFTRGRGGSRGFQLSRIG